MTTSSELEGHIKGWGADRSVKDRPGVPKEQAPERGTGAHWQEPDQQLPTVKIYHSIERPSITPVFGTSCPPRGLSGKLRDAAYTLGESRLAHWFLLLAADRIDVIEGMASDIRRGILPNPLAEMGLIAETRHPKELRRLARRRTWLAAGAGVAALAALRLLRARQTEQRSYLERGYIGG